MDSGIEGQINFLTKVVLGQCFITEAELKLQGTPFTTNTSLSRGECRETQQDPGAAQEFKKSQQLRV